MYSENIKPKADKIFTDLREKIREIVNESYSLNDTVKSVYQIVSSEIESMQ